VNEAGSGRYALPLAAAAERLRRPGRPPLAVSGTGQIAHGPTVGRVVPEARRETVLPAYVTPREVAETLRVDERTVLRWAQQDATMPVTRLGPGRRVVRFERAAFLLWLERKKPRRARHIAQDSPQIGSGDMASG